MLDDRERETEGRSGKNCSMAGNMEGNVEVGYAITLAAAAANILFGVHLLYKRGERRDLISFWPARRLVRHASMHS